MNREKIPKNLIDKLKSLGVGVVYLFGSQVQGTTHFDSDIDFGVVLIKPALLNNTEKKLDIYSKLYDFFTDFIPNKDIDVVLLQEVSLSVQFQAIKNSKILYEVSPIFRADFEESVVKFYLDFKPYLEERYKAILERIK